MRQPALFLALAACNPGPPAVATVPYESAFDSLGPEWSSKSPTWRALGGKLWNDGAHNVPLWLGAALPDDVRVSFSAESRSEAVDLKFEIFGNGVDHESGYIVIMSGWNNSTSIIARQDEHGPPRSPSATDAVRREYAAAPEATRSRYSGSRERVERAHRGEADVPYRFRFERQGGELRFFVNDELHLEYFDPAPLRGRGHDRFAFNNWASKVYFDDLVIEPL